MKFSTPEEMAEVDRRDSSSRMDTVLYLGQEMALDEAVQEVAHDLEHIEEFTGIGEDRVVESEQRVLQLEAENADLREELEATEERLLELYIHVIQLTEGMGVEYEFDSVDVQEGSNGSLEVVFPE